MELVKVCELSIYTAADIFVNGVSIDKAIIEEAQRCKLAGGTVIKAYEGFGSKKRGFGRAKSAIFSTEADLPIIIKIVDTRERIDTFLPFLDSIGEKHFVVTLHEVEVLKTKYIREHIDMLRKLYNEA